MTIKKKVIALIILLPFLSAVVAGLFYYQVSQSVSVKASMFDVSAQLTNGSNWIKWNPYLSHATISAAKKGNDNYQQVITTPNGSLLKLSIVSPASIITQQSITGGTVLQAINIHPGKVYGFTDLEWIKKQNGFSWLADLVFRKNVLDSQLAGLKTYVENPSHLYGFPIKLTGVTDTVICTKKQYILPGNTLPYIKAMVSTMHYYLQSNQIEYNKTYYYASYSALTNGKVELAVGIPVKTRVTPKQGYEFLELPVNGQILTGTYEGPYSQLGNLYTAMDKYVMDKRLTKVAQPMEKFAADAGSISAGTPVKMQIIYPVY